MLKIIHTGDIHLDTPFSGLDERRAEVRKTELRGTFSSLMTYVRLNSVDILLIAGDFFDCGFVTRETVAIVLREFSRVPECKIIISPGNHDPYTEDSVYAKVKWPDNVYIFRSEEMTRFEFPELNCDVYGYAFTGESMTECPIAKTEDNGRIKLLCAHAHLGVPTSTYAPVSAAMLADCGFNYAALGHVHNADPIAELDGCVYGYCGCLEGRGFDECGTKGAVSVELDVGKMSVRTLNFAKKHYESIEVSVTGANSLSDIIEKIRSAVKERHYGTDTVLRVTLMGEIPPMLLPSVSVIESEITDVFSLELKDETSAALDDAYLMQDPTVKGEYYRLLKPKLLDSDPEVRKTARLALRYGFAAMSGESITD